MLKTDSAGGTMLVSHGPIPGYMDAMAMPFRVNDRRRLDDLKPGARIFFTLSGGVARKIRVEQASTEGIVLPVPENRTAIGNEVPDFALTDQSGATVRLSDFRGKIVAVDFIYTRCPLPEVCPRLSANFARVQKRFHERMGKDLVLLSISLDPQYDTPEVLTRYAKIWGAEISGWRFLTGDLADIRRIAGNFGLVYWAEEGLLTHTSQTGIIDRGGKLAAIIEGSTFLAGQLGDLIAIKLEE